MKLKSIHAFPNSAHLVLENEDPNGTYAEDYTSTRLALYREDGGFSPAPKECYATALPPEAFGAVRALIQGAANSEGWRAFRVIVDESGEEFTYGPDVPNPDFGIVPEAPEFLQGPITATTKHFEMIVSENRIADGAQRTKVMNTRSLPAQIAGALAAVWAQSEILCAS